ncbi:MAG: hypothetical protein ACXVZW_09690 [Gaiellaceae bacterium]
MKRRIRWFLGLGLGMAPLLLAGAAPAAPEQASTIFPIAQLQVTAFTASAEETWEWSVSNQANNSGWATATGDATWSETLRPSRTKARIIVSSVNGKLQADMVGGIHVQATYDVYAVRKTKQHPPVSCSGGGSLPGGSTAHLEFEAAQSNPRRPKLSSEAVTFVWPDLSELGTGQKCFAHGADLKTTWFKKVEMLGDLTKGREISVHASGKIPIPVTSTEDCFGCIGFKGQGTYAWQASMTLRPS